MANFLEASKNGEPDYCKKNRLQNILKVNSLCAAKKLLYDPSRETIYLFLLLDVVNKA
jgi:hypothetical protein